MPDGGDSIASWTSNDLGRFIIDEISEGLRIEFKQDLPLPQGARGWRDNRRISPAERDGIAREIVAFANTYGGIIVVGIEESPDPPHKALALSKPIPDVHRLVDRLRSSLADIVEPPIPGLEVVAVPALKGADEGYVAIRVPQSSSGPHGFGSPPQVYRRRDDHAEPMSMREIQSLFWETRSMRERVEAILAASADTFAKYPPHEGIAFQFCAVTERPHDLRSAVAGLRSGKVLRNPSLSQRIGGAAASSPPSQFSNWKPTVRGAEYLDVHPDGRNRRSQWEIDDTGSLIQTGLLVPRRSESSQQVEVYPGCFAKSAGHFLGLVRAMSLTSSFPGDWIFEGRFVSYVEGLFVTNPTDNYETTLVDLSQMQRFRAIRIPAASPTSSFGEVEARIWAAFGVDAGTNPDVMNGVSEMEQYLSQ